jgi:hypothetical protein
MQITLQTGRVTSKLVAARWGKTGLDKTWANLIRRAWDERSQCKLKEGQPRDPNGLKRTLAFIWYAPESLQLETSARKFSR